MKAFKLEGTSMKPLFNEGGIAVVRPLVPLNSAFSLHPFRQTTGGQVAFSLSAGDCAVYELGGRALLHRVIGTEEKGAWLSDDAGRLAPHFVPWARIQGKVVSRNPLKNGQIGRAYSGLRRLARKLLRP